MFWCPTSEFPICPSGRPTASPEVLIAVCGQSLASLSILGVRARAMALPSLRGLIPQPSIIISTKGRGRLTGVVLILYYNSNGYTYISEGGGIWIRRPLRRRDSSDTC